jgi:hypothetical protein
MTRWPAERIRRLVVHHQDGGRGISLRRDLALDDALAAHAAVPRRHPQHQLAAKRARRIRETKRQQLRREPTREWHRDARQSGAGTGRFRERALDRRTQRLVVRYHRGTVPAILPYCG